MSWIEEIHYSESSGRLRQLYNRVKGPNDYLDNILTVHSLRPHSLHGHMSLYKHVLHHSQNTLPKWYLELLGVYVSYLNDCQYCVAHHFAGLRRLLGDQDRGERLMEAVETEMWGQLLEPMYVEGMYYARVLTLEPHTLAEIHIQTMREAGLEDGQILEINQVVSYFCYANRTVLGLGVNTAGDILGLSPNESSDPDNWSHG